MAKFRPISDAAFKKAQAKADKDQTPYAVDARFERADKVINISLNTGAEVRFNAHLARGLEDAPDKDLVDIAIEGGGTAIIFPKLDVYLSLGPLLEQFFGPMEWGRRERRAAASRENGKRGGRPKKVFEAVMA